MKFDAQTVELSRRERSKRLAAERHGIGCVIGAPARHLQLPNIRQVIDRRLRPQGPQKARERLTIEKKDGRARWRVHDVESGGATKGVFASEATDDRKAHGERVDQADDDIIAV